MGTEALGGGRILNAVSISEDHTLHLIGRLSHARAARVEHVAPMFGDELRSEALRDLFAPGSF
jgi:hypothetical protein